MLGRRELYHQQEGSLSGRCQIGFNALFALPIAARAVPSLALWNIAACTALIVVVINALFVRFLGFFGGVIFADFRHLCFLTCCFVVGIDFGRAYFRVRWFLPWLSPRTSVR